MAKYAQGVRASELSLVEAESPPTDSPAPGVFAPPPGAADGAAATDRFQAEAERELVEGYIDQPLWARAVVKAGGNEKLATQSYLRVRAAALRVEKRNQRAVRLARRARAKSVANGTLASASKPKYGVTGLTRKQLAWLTGILSFVLVAAALIVFRSGSEPLQRASAAGAVRSAPESAASIAAKGTSASAGPEIPRRDYAGRVRELKDAGNWNVLVLYAAEWTRTQPNNADAWKELSGGYLKLRQLNEAFEAASKAVEIAPQSAAMWRNLAQVNAALDDPPATLAAFERAVELDPQDVASLVQTGVLNMRLGRLAASKTALAKALALSPGDVDALCAAASLSQREGRPKDAEAMLLQVTSSGAKCRDPHAGESASVTVVKPEKAKPSSGTAR